MFLQPRSGHTPSSFLSSFLGLLTHTSTCSTAQFHLHPDPHLLQLPSPSSPALSQQLRTGKPIRRPRGQQPCLETLGCPRLSPWPDPGAPLAAPQPSLSAQAPRLHLAFPAPSWESQLHSKSWAGLRQSRPSCLAQPGSQPGPALTTCRGSAFQCGLGFLRIPPE